jgi:Flp pilus assembly protein TadD
MHALVLPPLSHTCGAERVSTSELLVGLGFCLQQQGMVEEAQQAHWQAFNQIGEASNHEALGNQLSLLVKKDVCACICFV